MLSVVGALVLGGIVWIATGVVIASVLAALAGFGAVTFGVGGFHADDTADRLREEKRRDRTKWSWWS
jgi:hypothetical protein